MYTHPLDLGKSIFFFIYLFFFGEREIVTRNSLRGCPAERAGRMSLAPSSPEETYIYRCSAFESNRATRAYNSLDWVFTL